MQLLGRYAFALARYDLDYDVRDRARLVTSLLVGVVPSILGGEEHERGEQGGVILRKEQVKMVLFEHKAPVKEPLELECGFSLATSSLVIGKPMASSRDLPEWLEQGTESSLRDTEDDIQAQGSIQANTSRSIASTSYGPTPIVLTPTRGESPAAAGSSPAPWTNLDQFYADVDEATESENGGDSDDTNNDSGGGASDVYESDAESVSDDESGTESEGSTTGRGIAGDNPHDPV